MGNGCWGMGNRVLEYGVFKDIAVTEQACIWGFTHGECECES